MDGREDGQIHRQMKKGICIFPLLTSCDKNTYCKYELISLFLSGQRVQLLSLYVRSTAGAKPSHAKHAYRYHAYIFKYTSNSRL